MDNNGLIELRRQILEQVIPLLETSSLSAEERFRLSMQIAQSQGTLDAYQRALESAQALEEPTDKLNALLDLLGEVDFSIQEESEIEDDASVGGDYPPQPRSEAAKPIVVN